MDVLIYISVYILEIKGCIQTETMGDLYDQNGSKPYNQIKLRPTLPVGVKTLASLYFLSS